MIYKYILAGDTSEDDEEVEFKALNDSAAVNHAQRNGASESEDGPIVYRQNPKPSRWGCGGDCCSGWIEVKNKELA